MAKTQKPPQGAFPFHLILADNATNARETIDGVEELAEDIKANGLLQALGLKFEENPELTEEERTALGFEADDKIPFIGRLIYGFRRYYAITKLREEDPNSFDEVKWEEVTGNSLDATYINLAENIARKNLTPGELAERFYTLRFNLKQEIDDIAARVPTLSKGYIQNLIALRKKLATPAWAAFKAGELTFDVAKTIASAKGEKAQEALLATAKKAGEGQEGAKKKQGVKGAVKAAKEGNEHSKPSVRDIKGLAQVYCEPTSPYEAGVIMALEFVLGARKTIPKAKPETGMPSVTPVTVKKKAKAPKAPKGAKKTNKKAAPGGAKKTAPASPAKVPGKKAPAAPAKAPPKVPGKKAPKA